MYSANQAAEPIVASDEELERHIASLSPVLLALSAVHMSGSMDILRSGVRPAPPIGATDVSGSLSAEDAATLRAKALEIIRAYRDDPQAQPWRPGDEDLREMMNFILGFEIPGAYVPMIREDMAYDAVDSRAFAWNEEPPAGARDASHTIIIGGGMSGMLMGLRLKQAGLPFTILEKNDGVGGTWFENRYPGLRVDVPSYSYSFSFIQDHRWSHLYSFQKDLLAYFGKCLERFGIADHVRYGVEVIGADWKEHDKCWDVAVRTSDGNEEALRSRSLVSACGFFNKPFIPEFEGRDSFAGEQWHSARFRNDVDLAGKRVAIIGNAATALQMIPPVAEKAAHLSVFQRSPSWTSVNPEYDRPISDSEQWAIANLPYFSGWLRVGMSNWPLDLRPDHMQIDPEWPQDGQTVSAPNAAARERFVAGYEEHLAGRPDLIDKLVPNYPLFVKRPTISNGDFFRAIQRDNVSLVTDSIQRITPRGIVDSSGTEHELDVIIYATGFRVQEYLAPMTIRGRGGEELNAFWQDRPGGFLGITVPHFPNFYMMYGPGTNLGYNGNLIYNSELQARYIAHCMRMMVERGLDAVEVTEEAFEGYMERTEDRLGKFVWSSGLGTTYFRNAAGRVTTNSPWSLLDMWSWTREPDPADYVGATGSGNAHVSAEAEAG